MEVEVKQAEGFYLKAVVNDISDEGLEVIYDKEWRKSEMVKYEQCRTILTDCGLKTNFKAGDIVDAFVRIDQNDTEEVCAWNRMKIRDIQNDFVVVESIEGSSTSISDTIPITLCRHPALTSSISSSNVKSCEIELHNELLGYFSRNEEAYKVLQESVPMILIKLDKEGKKLVVKTFSSAAIKKVDILKDTFLSNSRLMMLLYHRLEEQKEILSIEFDVAIEFMGLAIGAQGANINKARAINGIKEINLDESTRDQGYCKFKIFAENAEAAAQARNILEYLQRHAIVRKDTFGQVIEKFGKTLQGIVDKSGVVRVRLGDEFRELGWMLLTFTGTRDSIANAEMLVEFHLKYITKIDEIRAKENEIRRKFNLSYSSPNRHYNKNNGHPHPPQSFQQNDQTRQRHQGGQPQQQNKDSRTLNESDLQESSVNLDLAMSRANQVDELKTELASAHETEAASQKSDWTLTTTMDSTSQTLDVDKLMIQKLERNKIKLEEKIKELEANEEDMQKLLTGYKCEKASANQANAAMVEIAKKLTVVVTKQKKCLEIHKEFIDKLLVQLEEKEEQLQEKKQDNEEVLANFEKPRFFDPCR